MKAVQVGISGIKCDAPDCTYVDESVTLAQAESYVNKSCPLCGANLLTERDYALMKAMLSGADWLNTLVGPVPDDSKVEHGFIRMDGSGIPEIVMTESDVD